MFSRGVVLAAMRVLPYVRSEAGIISAAAATNGATGGADGRKNGAGQLALAVVSTLLAAVLLPVPIAAALIALAVFWRLSWKKIGGCTGDVLGATIEIAEIVFFLALAAEVRAGHVAGAAALLAGLLGITPF